MWWWVLAWYVSGLLACGLMLLKQERIYRSDIAYVLVWGWGGPILLGCILLLDPLALLAPRMRIMILVAVVLIAACIYMVSREYA